MPPVSHGHWPSHTVGLRWQGRWGGWSERAVRVLAACVGVLEVTLRGVVEEPGLHFEEALRELAGLLQAACAAAGAVALAAVHWTGEQPADGLAGQPRGGGRTRALRAALLGERVACEELLRAFMRPQALCGGTACTVCLDFFDTASPEHQLRAEARPWGRAAPQGATGASALALELPLRWLPEEAGGEGKSLVQPGSHWYQFCELFGEMASAEWFPSLAGATRRSPRGALLAHFRRPGGGHAMYEAVLDRYLFAPWIEAGDVEDCSPAVCALGEYEELRARLLAGWRARDEEVLFALRSRCPAAAAAGLPEEVLVTTASRRLVLGREPTCDVMLPCHHVSKAHALLCPQLTAAGGPWTLILQDTSSNGVWLNGERIPGRQFVQLKPGDRVCFLPPEAGARAGELEYEVGPSCSAAAALPRPAVPHSEGTGAALEAAGAGCRSRSRGHHSAADSHAEARRLPEVLQQRPRQRSHIPQLKHRLKPRQLDPEEELREWIRNLDNGDVVCYESALVQRFDSLEQIRNLYANNVSDFVQDMGVENPHHRASFRRAIMRLRTQDP